MLDTIYACNVFPLITKPTRVTKTTATLIDHILTNNIDITSDHLQGILCTDISDHYVIFHIAGNIKCDETNSPDVRFIRDIRQCNVNKFINEMQLVEWDSVTNKTETQAAYSEFHRILCEKYNKCFPYRKLSKPYHNNKPWLTNALKESIKTKNKLSVNRNKGSNTEDKNACYITFYAWLNASITKTWYYNTKLISRNPGKWSSLSSTKENIVQSTRNSNTMVMLLVMEK